MTFGKFEIDKGESMTIQFLRYIVSVAEIGSITETAKKLHISQPSLSVALKEAEREVGFEIFTRSRSGIALTKEGVEFLGYARQVIQEMSILEDRFILNQPEKQRFCVSTQHYTFTANAFVEMVQRFGRKRMEGTRLRLIAMDDRQAPPKGTEGTVQFVDDAGTIHVQWDTGSSLGLIPGTDEWEVIE